MIKHNATATSFRLTDEVRALLAEIAERRGVSRASALEWIIREKAEAIAAADAMPDYVVVRRDDLRAVITIADRIAGEQNDVWLDGRDAVAWCLEVRPDSDYTSKDTQAWIHREPERELLAAYDRLRAKLE